VSLHSDTDIYRAVAELAKFIARATVVVRRRGLAVDHRLTKAYA